MGDNSSSLAIHKLKGAFCKAPKISDIWLETKGINSNKSNGLRLKIKALFQINPMGSDLTERF